MNDEERLFDSASTQVIEDGKTYDHVDHGHVEVTGIWRQTQRLDAVQNIDGQDLIIVRFVPGENGEWIDELAEPLDDFLDAIE